MQCDNKNVDESLLTYSYGIFAHRNNDAFVLQFLQCVFELLSCDHLKRNREETIQRKSIKVRFYGRCFACCSLCSVFLSLMPLCRQLRMHTTQCSMHDARFIVIFLPEPNTRTHNTANENRRTNESVCSISMILRTRYQQMV